jgi:hypothetical protein
MRGRERGEESAGASSVQSHITEHSTTSNFDSSFPNNKQRGNIVITKLAVSISKMKITDYKAVRQSVRPSVRYGQLNEQQKICLSHTKSC